MQINEPDVLAEMEAQYAAYEVALVTNDVEKLDGFFWRNNLAIRYGGAENLYGFDEIAAFRSGRSPADLARDLERTVITTFGRDFATTSTLFRRTGSPGKIGRQMQSWVRLPEGWRIVGAHVSVIDEPA